MDRIDAMQAFVAVADLQGFAPAARKLGLSPSAVTRLVAALEERLGARLLQRTTRSVTLTDVGTRYLERARRILADVEEAERSARGRAHAAERAAGGLRAGRLRPAAMSARSMSAYLQRYPEVSGELRLADRMVNLVEDGVDLAVRIGHLADSSLVARQVGEMRRIVVASPAYLKRRGEPKTPEAIAAHDTIQFGATPRRRTGASSRTAARSRRRRRRASSPTAPMPRSSMPRQGGGPDAGAGLSGGGRASRRGRLKIVLAKFEQPALPIHIVYPTSRLLSAKVRTFIDLVIETSDWQFRLERSRRLFFRHHPERRVGARDHDVIGLDQALRKADRAAGLDHVASRPRAIARSARCR